jgi:hypothetical protein
MLGIAKSRIAEKNVSFKLGDVQLLTEENFAAVPKEEWDAVCRHVKIVEEECKRRDHEDNAMERIITSADEDDTSHSSHCHDDDTQGGGPLSNDSE